MDFAPVIVIVLFAQELLTKCFFVQLMPVIGNPGRVVNGIGDVPDVKLIRQTIDGILNRL